MLVYILGIFIVISVCCNIYLYKKTNQPAPKAPLDKDAQALLSELLAGPAVVKIDIIDKHSIIQWKG